MVSVYKGGLMTKIFFSLLSGKQVVEETKKENRKAKKAREKCYSSARFLLTSPAVVALTQCSSQQHTILSLLFNF